MANEEHLAILKDRYALGWNEWRARCSEVVPDLRAADLSGINLAWVNLQHADLTEVNFRGADLSDADLTGANLYGADLTEVNLTRTNCTRADLTRAKLTRANLYGPELTRAKVTETDFSEAVMHWATLGDMDLSRALGLGNVVHKAPLTIGIDTLYRSNGLIPDSFLRGAGVPEKFITYARSLIHQPICFYSCFISFSSQDQAMAERLYADLRAKNLRCWFAPEDLKIGDRFQERIEESIRLYDKVMIILSEESVKSRWVEREINAAREREDREKRTVLFPIRIDDAVMDAPQPWAADIRRSRHIGDFRRWKRHDSYQKALERLLRDLKADASAEPR